MALEKRGNNSTKLLPTPFLEDVHISDELFSKINTLYDNVQGDTQKCVVELITEYSEKRVEKCILNGTGKLFNNGCDYFREKIPLTQKRIALEACGIEIL